MKEKVSCDIQIKWADSWKGSIHLPPGSVYNLIITYPLSKQYSVRIIAGKDGMNVIELISRISQEYKKVYLEDSKSDGELYGIWGHELEDLHLEGIEVDHDKLTIKLFVGS